jgi:ankyrin repeat protein
MASSEQQPPTDSSKCVSLPPDALTLAATLFDYAREGKTNALSDYLTAGIPINMLDSKGNTFLMLAAYHGHADTVSMLLKAGADVNLCNDRGQSPVAGAVFKGEADVVRVLMKEGKADVAAGHPTALDCTVMFKRDDLRAILEGRETEEQKE